MSGNLVAAPAGGHSTFRIPTWPLLFLLLIAAARLPEPLWLVSDLLFYVAALAVPWWLAPQARATLGAWSRKGWRAVLLLTLAGFLLPSLLLAAIMKNFLYSLMAWPSPETVAAGMVGQGLRLAPAALAEEFFFRAWLQETIFAARWKERPMGPVTLKNLAAATLFAMAHLAARPSPAALLKLPGGLLFGWVMERSSGSLWPAVALHLAANLAVGWFRQLLELNSPW